MDLKPLIEDANKRVHAKFLENAKSGHNKVPYNLYHALYHALYHVRYNASSKTYHSAAGSAR